jgi:hypothetical protein
MENKTSIQEFRTMLQNDQENSLMQVLRQVNEVAKPEDVRKVNSSDRFGTNAGWVGWKY